MRCCLNFLFFNEVTRWTSPMSVDCIIVSGSWSHHRGPLLLRIRSSMTRYCFSWGPSSRQVQINFRVILFNNGLTRFVLRLFSRNSYFWYPLLNRVDASLGTLFWFLSWCFIFPFTFLIFKYRINLILSWNELFFHL